MRNKKRQSRDIKIYKWAHKLIPLQFFKVISIKRNAHSAFSDIETYIIQRENLVHISFEVFFPDSGVQT